MGKMSREAAESVKLRVEQLLTCRITGHGMSRDLSLWVRDLDRVLHGKLASVGLVESRASCRLADAVALFMASKARFKPGTRTVCQQAMKDLLAFFGDDFDVRRLTAGRADSWWTWMTQTRKLAPATIGKRVQTTRSMMERVKREGLIEVNPLEHLSGAVTANRQRQKFIDQPTIERVLGVCPCAEWRLIIALARYGGLRVPSELNRLKWADVLWDRDRFTVHASKTEHHAGGGVRHVPIFPELMPHLRESFELAESGAEYVLGDQRNTTNLRTHFHRLIKRAGLTPWPKLFQNLRASRETELLASFPIHVVTAWLGNSPKVALEHYAIVRDDDYAKAVQKAVQNAVQSGGGSCYTALQADGVLLTDSLEKERKTGDDMQLDTASRRIINARTTALLTGAGLEPATSGLKGRCSTIELPGPWEGDCSGLRDDHQPCDVCEHREQIFS